MPFPFLMQRSAEKRTQCKGSYFMGACVNAEMSALVTTDTQCVWQYHPCRQSSVLQTEYPVEIKVPVGEHFITLRRVSKLQSLIKYQSPAWQCARNAGLRAFTNASARQQLWSDVLTNVLVLLRCRHVCGKVVEWSDNRKFTSLARTAENHGSKLGAGGAIATSQIAGALHLNSARGPSICLLSCFKFGL